MVERRQGRFVGLRINCERVPLLPAEAVRRMRILADPRSDRCLLIWQNAWSGSIEDFVRVKRGVPPADFPYIKAIEVSRPGKNITDLHMFCRPLPRNGGNDAFLECPDCRGLRRGLYGWSAGGATTRSMYLSHWRCRVCAGLRYASEGGALLVRSRGVLGRMFGVGRAPRPSSWLPYVVFVILV
jgi:hypothetical protein